MMYVPINELGRIAWRVAIRHQSSIQSIVKRSLIRYQFQQDKTLKHLIEFLVLRTDTFICIRSGSYSITENFDFDLMSKTWFKHTPVI